MDREILLSKVKGGLFGCALGDAIGELAFRYRDRESLEAAIERLDTLVYTDDTAMALGLAESLARKKDVDPEDIGDTFAKNFYSEPWRGYASGPPTIFSMVRNSKLSYVDAARTLFGGSGSYGNGATMRIVPVGLFFSNSDQIYEKAAASAEVTHAHSVGKDGAAIQAMAIALAFNMRPGDDFDPLEFIEKLEKAARTEEIKNRLSLLKILVRKDVPPSEAIKKIGRSVAVHESMPFSLYSFLKFPEDFKKCLYCAVLHGGDRDTLGAMACSIAGSYLGIENLPAKWLLKVENRNYIDTLAEELARAKGILD